MLSSPRLKTRDEIEAIDATCRSIERVIRKMEPLVVPGLVVDSLMEACGDFMAEESLLSLSLPDRGNPPCLVSVNEVAGHGSRYGRSLQPGDLLTLDISAQKKGWAGDRAVTWGVEPLAGDLRRLVEGADLLSRTALTHFLPGSSQGAMLEVLSAKTGELGLFCFSELTGHGLGRDLHEAPVVYYNAEHFRDFFFVPGMVLTAEPVVSLRPDRLFFDEVTGEIRTESGIPTAQFEYTVAITSGGPRILGEL